MRTKQICGLLCGWLLLIGCRAPAQVATIVIQTVLPTHTTQPTATASAIPTATPSPVPATDTPTPSHTPTPTSTPRPSETPTPSPTAVKSAENWQIYPLTAIFDTIADSLVGEPVVSDIAVGERVIFVYLRNVVYVLDYQTDTILGSLELPASTSADNIAEHYYFQFTSLALAGETLYAVDENIYVIDIADPTAPQLQTTLPRSGYGNTHAKIVDGWLLIDDSSTLFVYDISTPTAPQLTDSLHIVDPDFSSGIYAIELIQHPQGDFLLIAVGSRSLVADGRSGLVIVDFNDPTNLSERVALPSTLLEYVSQVAAVGERLYVNEYANEIGWLHEIAVTNIDAPTVSRSPLTGYAFRPLVAFNDQLLFFHRTKTCPLCLYFFDGVELTELDISAERAFWGTNGHTQRITLKATENALFLGGQKHLYYLAQE